MLDEIIDRIDSDINLIKCSETIQEQFEEVKSYLRQQKVQPIYYFSQIKRNPEYEGLISETMFIDGKFVYDIVVGSGNMDIHLLAVEQITKIRLVTMPRNVKKKESNNEEYEVTEYLPRLIIFYQEQSQLYYEVPAKKYSSLVKMMNELTKLI